MVEGRYRSLVQAKVDRLKAAYWRGVSGITTTQANENQCHLAKRRIFDWLGVSANVVPLLPHIAYEPIQRVVPL